MEYGIFHKQKAVSGAYSWNNEQQYSNKTCDDRFHIRVDPPVSTKHNGKIRSYHTVFSQTCLFAIRTDVFHDVEKKVQ